MSGLWTRDMLYVSLNYQTLYVASTSCSSSKTMLKVLSARSGQVFLSLHFFMKWRKKSHRLVCSYEQVAYFNVQVSCIKNCWLCDKKNPEYFSSKILFRSCGLKGRVYTMLTKMSPEPNNRFHFFLPITGKSLESLENTWANSRHCVVHAAFGGFTACKLLAENAAENWIYCVRAHSHYDKCTVNDRSRSVVIMHGRILHNDCTSTCLLCLDYQTTSMQHAEAYLARA